MAPSCYTLTWSFLCARTSLVPLVPLLTCFLLTGLARGHRDQRQASRRWLQAGGQECECKDWFQRAPKRKLMTVPGLPQKQCPCDHFKGNVKKTRKHHRKLNKHSRACQQFLKRCQLASLALPL
uniref:C-X-C motif chemokine 17 n=1 Tax=Equus asinus TaxID=9793 RepID=A0A8C4LBK9_EQUAS